MQKMQNINRKKREETEKSRWSFFLFLKKRKKLNMHETNAITQKRTQENFI